MSPQNERDDANQTRPANENDLPSVIEIAADLLCHGAGEVASAAFHTAQVGSEAFCAVASSAGGVIVDAAGHGVTIVGHVAAAAAESAGDALG